MEVQELIKQTGDLSSKPTSFILEQLNNSGILVSELTAKIVSILVISVAIFILIKVVKNLDKLVKGIIIILLFALGLSILYSMFI